MTALPAPGSPADVLELIGPAPTSSSPSPTANRSPSSTRSRRRPSWRSRRCPGPPMHALHPRGYLDGGTAASCGTSYFLSAPDSSPLPRRRARPRPCHFSEVPSCCAGCRTSSWSPPARHPTGMARSASAPTPTTSRRSSAVCRSSSRPTPACRGPSAATGSTSQVAGWCGGRPNARRSRAVGTAMSTTASPSRSPSGSPTVPAYRRGSARSPTPCSGRCRATGSSASTERCPTASSTSSRLGGDGRAEGSATGKVVTTFALGTNRLYEFLDGNLRGAAAGRLGERSADHRPGAGRLDQRDHGGRLPRAGGVGDDRRPVLVPLGRARRLRPRCHVLRRGQAFWCSDRRLSGARSADRSSPRYGSAVTTLKNTVDKVVTEYGSPSCVAGPCERGTPSSASPTLSSVRSSKPRRSRWVGGEAPTSTASSQGAAVPRRLVR